MIIFESDHRMRLVENLFLIHTYTSMYIIIDNFFYVKSLYYFEKCLRFL